MLLSAPQDPEEHDPLATIHALLQKGNYADAAEAIGGLPEPYRSREWASFYFDLFYIDGSREAAARALAVEPRDARTLRIRGDADFVDGRYRDARASYAKALTALASDPALTDAARAEEKALLEGREQGLRREEEYRALVAAATGRARNAAAGFLAFTALGSILCFAIALRGRK